MLMNSEKLGRRCHEHRYYIVSMPGALLCTALSFLQVVLLDIMEETGQRTCKELCNEYGDKRVVFYRCDVTSAESLVSILITGRRCAELHL